MDKTLIIMRGLPATGKSYRAKELAGDTGLIYSTDEYWYRILKPEQPEVYSFNPHFLSDAHHWNQQRTFRSIERGEPLIIIDNTNVTIEAIQPYIEYACPQDYKIKVEEPTSPWWLEIRQLLFNKRQNKKEIKEWAIELGEKSKLTHKVPAWSIERMMWRWDAYVQNKIQEFINGSTLQSLQTVTEEG
jgi:predicted kinase